MRKVLLSAALIACSIAAAAPQKKPVTLESVRGGRAPRGVSPVWAPSGDRFVYTQSDAIQMVDCGAAKTTEVIRLARLRSAAMRPRKSETADWTNRRVTAQAIQWFPSGKELL